MQTLGSDSIEILSRTKDANENAESWNRLVQMFGTSIGIIEKDSFDGKFIDEYKKFVTLPTKDVSLQLSLILAVKDDIELVSSTLLTIENHQNCIKDNITGHEKLFHLGNRIHFG